MSDLVLTGWSGVEHAQMAAHTLPVMQAYATRHGLGFGCANLGGKAAPPSWMKVPAIGMALVDHERVLWLDADVVIADPTENIFDRLEADAWQALVEHETECGLVPNCGVWVVTREMAPWLKFAWDRMLDGFLDHPWWEQAAVMSMMGYRITLTDGWPHATLEAATELHDRTQFLPGKWNYHRTDRRQAGERLFLHFANIPNRIEEIRNACSVASQRKEA